MLKDTVDGDGVAELAAQSAAERPIGDLSAHELREKTARVLAQLELGALSVVRALEEKGFAVAGINARQLLDDVRAVRREVRP